MSTLGIIGAVPSDQRAPVRADKLARLTPHVGALEAAPADQFPALHAAAHALMNGVSRVLVAPICEPGGWLDALKRLLSEETVPLVVAPGVVDIELARALAAAVLRESRTVLWLDAPEGDAARTVQHRGRLPGARDRVRVVRPWVRGLTPGRPGSERLPASCLIAPLHLGTARTLAGTFHAPPPPSPQDLADLKRTGCGVLAAVGYQKRLGLAYDLPRPGPDPRSDARPTLAQRIEEALREATDPIIADHPGGVGLQRSLERAATPVLTEFQRRGEVTEFRVRCVPGGKGPVVEVAFRTPRYVREFVVRTTGPRPGP